MKRTIKIHTPLGTFRVSINFTQQISFAFVDPH